MIHKIKITNLISLKLETFCSTKDTTIELKYKPQTKNIANHISDKLLIFRIKNSQNPIIRKQPNKNWEKEYIYGK